MNKLKFYKFGFYLMLSATFIMSMFLYDANHVSKNTSDNTALDNLDNSQTVIEKTIDKKELGITIERIVIYMTKKNDKVTVYVDGKKTAYPDLLNALAIPMHEKGKETVVHTIFTENVMLTDVDNMSGVVSKVGFGNRYYFIKYGDHEMIKVNLYNRTKLPKNIIDSKQ